MQEYKTEKIIKIINKKNYWCVVTHKNKYCILKTCNLPLNKLNKVLTKFITFPPKQMLSNGSIAYIFYSNKETFENIEPEFALVRAIPFKNETDLLELFLGEKFVS